MKVYVQNNVMTIIIQKYTKTDAIKDSDIISNKIFFYLVSYRQGIIVKSINHTYTIDRERKIRTFKNIFSMMKMKLE